MYGTVERLKIKPGMESELIAFGRWWVAEVKPVSKGAIGGHIYQLDSDPSTLIMAVLFEDKESYHTHARDPVQDRAYQRLRALLSADPVWEDGEVISTF